MKCVTWILQYQTTRQYLVVTALDLQAHVANRNQVCGCEKSGLVFVFGLDIHDRNLAEQKLSYSAHIGRQCWSSGPGSACCCATLLAVLVGATAAGLSHNAVVVPTGQIPGPSLSNKAEIC